MLSTLAHVQMEKALVSLTLKSDERDEESRDLTTPQKPDDSNTVASTASAAQVPAALKGVPQSLLDRVGTGTGFFTGDYSSMFWSSVELFFWRFRSGQKRLRNSRHP